MGLIGFRVWGLGFIGFRVWGLGIIGFGGSLWTLQTKLSQQSAYCRGLNRIEFLKTGPLKGSIGVSIGYIM